MNDDGAKFEVEQVDSVSAPPRARVDDAEAPAAKLGRKRDYLEDFLSQQPQKVTVRLQDGCPAPPREPRLDLAHQARQTGREGQHDEHLDRLQDQVSGQFHIVSPVRRRMSEPKTRPR